MCVCVSHLYFLGKYTFDDNRYYLLVTYTNINTHNEL